MGNKKQGGRSEIRQTPPLIQPYKNTNSQTVRKSYLFESSGSQPLLPNSMDGVNDQYAAFRYSTPWDTQFFNGTANSQAFSSPRFSSTPLTHVYNHPCWNPAIPSTSISSVFPSTQPSGNNYFPVNQSISDEETSISPYIKYWNCFTTVSFSFQVLNRDMMS